MNKYLKIDVSVLVASIIAMIIYEVYIYPQAVSRYDFSLIYLYLYLIRPLLYISFAYVVTYWLYKKLKVTFFALNNKTFKLLKIILIILLLIDLIAISNIFITYRVILFKWVINNPVYYFIVGWLLELITIEGKSLKQKD